MTNIDSMLLPDLKKVASSLGVKSAGLRKAELVAAIRAQQGNGAPSAPASAGEQPQRTARRRAARPEGAPEQAPQEALPAAAPAA